MYDKTITRTYYGHLDIGNQSWVSSVGNVTTACEPTGYCPWCSQPSFGSWVYHGGHCPKVKSIEYHPKGSVKRVEFHDENISAKVKWAYVCGEWREVKDDYPPLFYERVIDEVVKKLTDYSRLARMGIDE